MAKQIVLAANLAEASDIFLGLSRRVSSPELSRPDKVELEQAEITAGAAIWDAVQSGFIRIPDVVAVIRELSDNGDDVPDTVQEGAVVCANMFHETMRIFYYPLGEGIAPYTPATYMKYVPGNPVHDSDLGRLEFQRELRDQANCCALLAEVIRTGDDADFMEKLSPTPADSSPTPAVSKSGKVILAALLKQYPMLQTIEEICDEVRGYVSERTIGPELNQLIDAGLAERPQGERKGATLTPTGKALAENLSAS
jgi:hypothetical protein